jgi:hypothetical protein
MKRGESFIDSAANYEIVIQLERHKNYPAAAQAHHETGVATVAFSIDREGKVVATSCRPQLRLCVTRSGDHRYGPPCGTVPAASSKFARGAEIRFHSANRV